VLVWMTTPTPGNGKGWACAQVGNPEDGTRLPNAPRRWRNLGSQAATRCDDWHVSCQWIDEKLSNKPWMGVVRVHLPNWQTLYHFDLGSLVDRVLSMREAVP